MQENIERGLGDHGNVKPHGEMIGLVVGVIGGAAVWALATLVVMYLM